MKVSKYRGTDNIKVGMKVKMKRSPDERMYKRAHLYCVFILPSTHWQRPLRASQLIFHALCYTCLSYEDLLIFSVRVIPFHYFFVIHFYLTNIIRPMALLQIFHYALIHILYWMAHGVESSQSLKKLVFHNESVRLFIINMRVGQLFFLSHSYFVVSSFKWEEK